MQLELDKFLIRKKKKTSNQVLQAWLKMRKVLKVLDVYKDVLRRYRMIE